VPRAVLFDSFDELCPDSKSYYIFGVQEGIIQIDSLVEYDGRRWVIGSERAFNFDREASELT